LPGPDNSFEKARFLLYIFNVPAKSPMLIAGCSILVNWQAMIVKRKGEKEAHDKS
jgi:hypothetical protein